MTSNKTYLDIALIVPLQEELEAIFSVFDFKSDLTIGDFQITELVSPNNDIRICVIKQHKMGHSAARSACEHLISHYQVGAVCSFGIAGGLSPDVHLGDICISQTVYDLTDNAKFVDLDDHVDVQFSPTPYHVDRGLCSRLAFLTQNPALTDVKSNWQSGCKSHFEQSTDQLGASVADSAFASLRTPTVHFGPLVSGSVTASDALKDKLQLVDRKVLAIETECSGVFEIAGRQPALLCFAVRAISDYADPDKTALEAKTKNTVRYLSAKNAAAYLYHQLCNSHFVGYLIERNVSPTMRTAISSDGHAAGIDKLLSQAERDIEDNLRETCPAYRTKSKGYVLPPPRIAPAESAEHLDPQPGGPIQEISVAIEQYDRILISLQFTYPDDALCWVIADHILRTNGERLFVPTVMDASSVKAGRFDLGTQQDVLAQNATPVVILDNPDVRSKRHSESLIQEASRYQGIKFIIVSRDNNFTVDTGDFLSLFNCELFHSASFSLVSLSNFISSNFDMIPQQADYTAIRLWEVFEKFNMHAHPSYFAGISQDVLYALITANRRGELIQLAVEGALMLLVAADREAADNQDVAVSRTFRKKFLIDLLVCQDILKEPVNEARAVNLAKEVAEKYDLEVSPSRFVASFIDIGLINFQGGRTNFNASYVRDYLLAEFLAGDAQEARSYFDLEEENMELNVLDIYAEIGPDPELIDRIIALVEADVKMLDERRPNTRRVLIEDRPQPRMLVKPASARAKRKSVEKAVEYVGQNASDLERKQNILDFHNTVASRVVEHKNRAHGEGEGDDIPRRRILLHWRMGCTLLGGGAEQIEKGRKRRLAGLLIRLGNRIAEVWTSELEDVDFEALRQSVIADESYMEMEQRLEPSQRYKLREDLQRVIDSIEYEVTSLPYRAVLYSLCGTGWENNLRLSVRECQLSDGFDELTRAIWVSDLQPNSAKEVCKVAFSGLGNARLLRYLLADHFISRVYWDKWKRSERSKMLDLAGELVAPLGVSLKKAEISRAAKISARKRRRIRRTRRKRN